MESEYMGGKSSRMYTASSFNTFPFWILSFSLVDGRSPFRQLMLKAFGWFFLFPLNDLIAFHLSRMDMVFWSVNMND